MRFIPRTRSAASTQWAGRLMMQTTTTTATTAYEMAFVGVDGVVVLLGAWAAVAERGGDAVG